MNATNRRSESAATPAADVPDVDVGVCRTLTSITDARRTLTLALTFTSVLSGVDVDVDVSETWGPTQAPNVRV